MDCEYDVCSEQMGQCDLQDLSGGDGCASTLGSALCDGLDFRTSDDKRPANGVISETLIKVSLCGHYGMITGRFIPNRQ